jgi:hypothetical protein
MGLRHVAGTDLSVTIALRPPTVALRSFPAGPTVALRSFPAGASPSRALDHIRVLTPCGDWWPRRVLQQTREARQLLPSQGAARRLCSGTLALFKAHARAASDGGTAACGVRRCRARRPEPGRHHRWRAPRCSSPWLCPLVAPIPVDMIPRSFIYFSWCLPWSDELTAPPCEPTRWCSSEQTK